MSRTKPTTVDEYIEAAPKEAQEMLREMRALLKEAGRVQNQQGHGTFAL